VLILKGLRHDQNFAKCDADFKGVVGWRWGKKNVGRLEGPFANGEEGERKFGLKEVTRQFASRRTIWDAKTA
jgi:hypothetical protein